MARRHDRAPRGRRAVGHMPAGSWASLTMLSAVEHDGTTTSLVDNGGTDGAVLLTFLTMPLAPRRGPGKMLVRDTLAAHHDPRVAEAVAATGVTLRFLPRYWSDLNPIKPIWSKVKALLRAWAENLLRKRTCCGKRSDWPSPPSPPTTRTAG